MRENFSFFHTVRYYNFFNFIHSSYVVPICLDTRKLSEIPLKKQIVAGWGRTSNDDGAFGEIGRVGAASSKLMKVETPFIPIDECKKNYPVFRGLNNETLIYAGGLEGKDSCSGDSGGPLITYRGTVPGI